MVLISRKVDYALLVLHHLMVADGPACARQLAEHYGLSRPFVANILKELCRHGLVTSHRGVNGGYRLGRCPEQISLAEVIEALEGRFQLTACADVTPAAADAALDHECCCLLQSCPTRGALQAVHERLLAVLGGVTLAHLRRPPAHNTEHDEGGCRAGASRLVALHAEAKADGRDPDLPG